LKIGQYLANIGQKYMAYFFGPPCIRCCWKARELDKNRSYQTLQLTKPSLEYNRIVTIQGGPAKSKAT